jgi:serine phosphatase RsbU (regulator of sigma subunit)
MGAVGVRLFFADVEERLLILWGAAGADLGSGGERVILDGSVHGRVYLSADPERAMVGGSHCLLIPILGRSERMGVLEARFDAEPTPEVEEAAAAIGLLLGYVIVAADRWTDEFHVARRRQDMTLAAELQWNLLPLGASSTRRMAVAGALEPAYDIAGDLFDYACGRDRLTVGIFDAMGHGVAAARSSALAVAAFRNARRCRRGLEDQARFIHESLARHGPRSSYVTGQLVEVDLEDPARSSIVNAGHPLPLLQRGTVAPRRIDLLVDLPFGMPFEGQPSRQALELLTGDRLVMFTDGVTEASPDAGEAFGDDRLARELIQHRHHSPRDAARGVISSVRAHRAADLLDDATVLVVDVPDDGAA